MSQKDEFPNGPTHWHAPRMLRANMPWLWMALALAAVVLCAIAIWPMQAARLNQEGGLIETGSAVTLFTAGLVALIRFPGIKRLYIATVCLLLAERELESDIYASDSIAFQILDGLDWILDLNPVRVVLAIVVLGGLVWHGVPTGWRAVKIRAPFLVVFVLAGGAAVAAQVFEAISGAYGASMTTQMTTRLFALEETLEMFFSIGILASVLMGWPKSMIEETAHDTFIRPGGRRSLKSVCRQTSCATISRFTPKCWVCGWT